MAKKRVPLTDQLREAIDGCGVTRYRIAKDTGIDQSTLAKFHSGERGLSMDAMDAIGVYLDLRIVTGPKTKKGK